MKEQNTKNTPGNYVAWLTNQTWTPSEKKPFDWKFPRHFYTYLALRELESEGRYIRCGGEWFPLKLPPRVHTLYEAYCDIRLAPVSAPPVDDDAICNAGASAVTAAWRY